MPCVSWLLVFRTSHFPRETVINSEHSPRWQLLSMTSQGVWVRVTHFQVMIIQTPPPEVNLVTHDRWDPRRSIQSPIALTHTLQWGSKGKEIKVESPDTSKNHKKKLTKEKTYKHQVPKKKVQKRQKEGQDRLMKCFVAQLLNSNLLLHRIPPPPGNCPLPSVPVYLSPALVPADLKKNKTPKKIKTPGLLKIPRGGLFWGVYFLDFAENKVRL